MISKRKSSELVVHLTYGHIPHDNSHQPLEDNQFTLAQVVDDLKSQIALPRFYRFNVFVLKTLALAALKVSVEICASNLALNACVHNFASRAVDIMSGICPRRTLFLVNVMIGQIGRAHV